MIGDDPQADAVRARQLLDDEMLDAVMKALEREAVDRLVHVGREITDHAYLISLVAELQATRSLRSTLEAFLTSGKLAEARAETPPVA